MRVFNPRRDPIVRTEAVRLRGRLGEYYLNGGRTDPLIIELPKGGYAPVFRRPDVGSEILQTEVKLARKPRRVPLRLAIALASQVAIAAAAVFWRLYRQTTPIPIAVLPLENVVTIPKATSSPTASPAKLSGTFR